MSVFAWVSMLAVVIAVALASSDATQHANGQTADPSGEAPTIVQSLFRFPASMLGPEFDELVQLWYKETFHLEASKDGAPPPITPEEEGLEHAFYSVSTSAATLFRRQCYGPAPLNSTNLNNLYNNFEQRLKEIQFEDMHDKAEELRLTHTVTNRFHPAFLPQAEGKGGGDQGSAAIHVHRKKSKSNIDTVYAKTTIPHDFDTPSNLAHFTSDSADDGTQQWAWRPPAHYSSRTIANTMKFRQRMWVALRTKLEPRLKRAYRPDFEFEHGRSSGMFWYPPGSVREWHTNKLDVLGDGPLYEEVFSTQVWRMYYIRTVRGAEFDAKLKDLRRGGAVDSEANDHSAMHIIPGGSGITREVLRNAGARRLAEGERERQWRDVFAEPYDRQTADLSPAGDAQPINGTVWRLPDLDGYVTLFRLPDIWHCIVSEEVHRYSLGFAFSDSEVRALLSLAGVDFDLSSRDGAGDQAESSRDEL